MILDELPESPANRDHLKSTITKYFINLSKINKTRVIIYKNRIQEADSKEHAILQCIDIITGVIEFYLNNSKIDSNKGKAKLKIFNHIYNNYIKYFVPDFSFIKTTGYLNCFKAWLAPYKHFVYKNIKKAPDIPT